MYIADYKSIQQEIELSEKQKQTPAYFSEQADFLISSYVRKRVSVETARNYHAGIREEDDFAYLEDMYGMHNPIELGFTNIIKPRVDALIGLSLLSEPDFRVAYTDRDTIKKVEKEKLDGVLKELKAELKRKTAHRRSAEEGKQSPEQGGSEPNAKDKDWLEKLTSKYGEDFESSYQIAAQHILRLIETDADINMAGVKKEAAKDYFITGEAYTREIYQGDGKDPTKESITPENMFTNRAKGEKDLKSSSVAISLKRVTVHQVLKELGDKITTEEAEELFNAYSSLSGTAENLLEGEPDVMIKTQDGHEMDRIGLKTGFSNSGGALVSDLVDFYHVEWLASTKIPNGKGGYVYREDRYEVYRVGATIYVGGRRCAEAPRRQDTPWKTTLSYKGIINTSPAGNIVSLVNSMREIQDLYDIMIYFRNNLVANSGVSGSRVNIAAIPKALGEKFMERLVKWQIYRKQGMELVDPTEEGAERFQHYGDFNAALRGEGVNAINAILESITVQADIISGVPRQMLGVIEQRDAVENVKVGINQVSVLSLELFREVDQLLNQGNQETLDNFKFAYRNKPKQGIYRNGTKMVPFIVSPTKFSLTDYKVTVTSTGIENAKLLKVQQLAKDFVAAGALDPLVVIMIMNIKSVHEIENALRKAIAEKKEENNTIGQLQQAVEQAQEESKQLKAEVDRLTNNIKANDAEKMKLENRKVDLEDANKKRELDIAEKKIKVDEKEGKAEIAADVQRVELEKEQLLFGPASSKEIKNN